MKRLEVKKCGQEVLRIQLHELRGAIGAIVLFILIQFATGTALAATFGRGLLICEFTWLIGAENGRDHLPLAIAVQVMYAKPRGSHKYRGGQQVNRDMSK